MDEKHLLVAARYIEMNPVAAKLVAHPREYRWSSCCAHLEGKDDHLVKVAPLLELVSDWSNFLSLSSTEELNLMHSHERTGRPLGASAFVESLERTLGRALRPKKPGPKKKGEQG